MRDSVSIAFGIAALLVLSSAQARPPKDRAVVHVKIVAATQGQDLGQANVTLFKSKETGIDYASKFQANMAVDIPYGTYLLRAHQEGFWSADREVVVRQSEVWIVLGLHVGAENLETAYELTGSIRGLSNNAGTVWARLVGVYSAKIADAKVDPSGSFLIAGLPPDMYVLIVRTETSILKTTILKIPGQESLEIDLSK